MCPAPDANVSATARAHSTSSRDRSPDAWREHPHRGGIPILFPWPGRVAGARFTFEGREYRLPVNEPARGHSIHGFACERAFRVTRRGPYFVTSILDSSDYPDLSSIWPWPFVLEIDYEVGNGLRLKARVTNTGDSAMPFGFGAHPYFHAPLNPRGKRDAMLVQLDADARWPLDANLDSHREDGAAGWQVRSSRAASAWSRYFDDAFRMAPSSQGDDAAPRARLIDPSLKIAVEVRADAAFGHFVVFAPPARSRSRARALHLRARRVQSRGTRHRGGMRELAPGQTFEARFEIRLNVP